MDGFNQVMQVPGDMNPDPRGLDGRHGQPRGGLRYYQDELDTNKEDLATEEVGDDPGTRKVQEPSHTQVMTDEDVREEVEDSDEADRN